MLVLNRRKTEGKRQHWAAARFAFKILPFLNLSSAVGRLRLSARAVPVGVEISDAGIGVVSASIRNREFIVNDAQWTAFPGALEEANRPRAVSTLIGMLARMNIKRAYCVLSVPGADVFAREMDVEPRARRSEVLGMAGIIADQNVKNYTATEREIGVAPLGTGRYLLSVVRKTLVRHIVEIARAADLRPVAVDTSWCAWQRAFPNADAVLDVRGDVAELSVFSQRVNDGVHAGESYVFKRGASVEEIAFKTGDAFLKLRKNKGFQFERLVLIGNGEESKDLVAGLERIGNLAIVPAQIAGRSDVAWALAFGLAQWVFPDYGATEIVRTNLLGDPANVVRLFGIQIPDGTVRESMWGAAIVAATICSVLLLQNGQIRFLQAREYDLSSMESQIAPRVAVARRLVRDIGSLQAIGSQLRGIRESGNDLALSLCALGNAFGNAGPCAPGHKISAADHVWLTSLDYADNSGWTAVGGGRSYADVGALAAAINRDGDGQFLLGDWDTADTGAVSYRAVISPGRPASTLSGAAMPSGSR